MKVISGLYKGRNIEGFDIKGTRPTMDRVKESLFAMIQDYLEGSIILDLFSGSGNLAIEALSWKAKFAYIVDNNEVAIKTIKKNMTNIGITDYLIMKADFKKALANLQGERMNIIFLDPPYNTNYIEESIKLIDKYNLLVEDGIIVCESDIIDKIIYSEKFKCIKEKKYGDKWVCILKQI